MSEIDLEKLGEKIFSEEPKPKFSIQLQFEDGSIIDIFESMLMLVTQGMKKKFSDDQGKVQLSKLTPEKLDYFNLYLHSFGMCLEVNILDYNPFVDYNKLKYQNMKITEQTKLSDLKFPMLDCDKVYVISFDFFRNYA